eukprot:GHRQ01021144.1.p1 GENE.GHRQ01021144.1~~GHRQ01021144.1.p1  ORF type:complete len:169 (+),score=0.20 GHRQ01021144.1:571-1077(+)
MVRMGVLPSTTGVTALGVFSMLSLPLLSVTSHDQPEPNCVAPAATNAHIAPDDGLIKTTSDSRSSSRACCESIVNWEHERYVSYILERHATHRGSHSYSQAANTYSSTSQVLTCRGLCNQGPLQCVVVAAVTIHVTATHRKLAILIVLMLLAMSNCCVELKLLAHLLS